MTRKFRSGFRPFVDYACIHSELGVQQALSGAEISAEGMPAADCLDDRQGLNVVTTSSTSSSSVACWLRQYSLSTLAHAIPFGIAALFHQV